MELLVIAFIVVGLLMSAGTIARYGPGAVMRALSGGDEATTVPLPDATTGSPVVGSRWRDRLAFWRGSKSTTGRGRRRGRKGTAGRGPSGRSWSWRNPFGWGRRTRPARHRRPTVVPGPDADPADPMRPPPVPSDNAPRPESGPQTDPPKQPGGAPPDGPGSPGPAPNQPPYGEPTAGGPDDPLEPETLRARSWRDDRPGPQVATPNPESIEGAPVSGELTPSGGGAVAPLEAGTITTPDIRRYYEDVRGQLVALVQRLDGLSEADTACIGQYTQVAAAASAIADQFESTISAMRAEGIDEAIIAEAIRQQEAVRQIQRIAETAAERIEQTIREARTQIKEQASIAGSAGQVLLDLMEGYRASEDAVQSAPVSMPVHTRVLGAR